jgi:hypothetical protein
MKLQLVFRTLQDFVWLRRQLLLQFNEAILPELSTETDSSATRIEKPLHQLIARQVNRLDRFLGDLLAHPEISQDSTFIDFITALVLDVRNKE